MGVKDFLEIITLVCSIVVVVVVGRDNIKKQTISDLQALVLAHEKTINMLEKKLLEKDERICALEDLTNGYAQLVQEGDFFGSGGARSRNRSAASKTTKNRTT